MPSPSNMSNGCLMTVVFLLGGLLSFQVFSGCVASKVEPNKSIQFVQPVVPTTNVETNITKAVEVKF